MWTRQMRFFALPHELIELLIEQSNRLGLVATVYPPSRGSDVIGSTLSLSEIPAEWSKDPLARMRIFLHKPENARSLPWQDVNPGQFDWVDVQPGRLRGAPRRPRSNS